jgi:AmmeMemoRadiSam system protein B
MRSGGWYPEEKEELVRDLKAYINNSALKSPQEVHGLIVPHAGYVYSGAIAGRAYALLKSVKKKKVIIFGPSHYEGFYGIKVAQLNETPLGKVKIMQNNFKIIEHDHSVDNQIPFLQYLGFEEFLPLVVGDVSLEDAKRFAEQFFSEDALFIFSTDLSHFLPYEDAVKKDKKTIEIIERVALDEIKDIDACGIHPLSVLFYLCQKKNWIPHLIEYKNSGDVTGDKTKVVGYASFWF